MTHEDIKTLISAYLDNETTPAETRMVEEHLKTCVECQKDFRIYKSMSSSLAKWPNETLSPDEEINVQKHLEPRREPMFTQRTATLLTTTIALGLLIGSVLQMELKHGVQGHLKSDGSIPFMETFSAKKEPASEYKPSYLSGPYRTMSMAGAAPAQWLGAGAQKSAYYSADANTSLGRLDAANVPAVVREQLMGKTLNSAPVVPVNAQFAATPDLQSMYYQNSGYYSGTDVDRKKIRQADIDLRVENAFKTKSQLTDLILQSNGIVLNSVFNRTDDGSGHGTMICKVYPKDLEHLLQQIRGLGEV